MDQDPSVLTAEIIDLMPSEELSVDDLDYDDDESIALITGGSPSYSSSVNPLLHERLKAAIIALLVLYGISFAIAAFGILSGSYAVFPMALPLHVLRVVLLGGALGLLCSRPSFSNTSLRAIEYCLFGALAILWIYFRYESMVFDASAGNITEVLLKGRYRLIELLVVIFIHALFVPHAWQGAARVAVTLALAPSVVLAMLSAFHPELTPILPTMLSIGNLLRETGTLMAGVIVAIYGASQLNELRAELHDARQLGQYRLMRMLGRGGMGEVYLAEHALLKRPCALKLIRTQDAGDPTALARFEREVRSTAQLTHPNTVEIFDYGHTDDGTFYYVMEYLPGLSVQQLIRREGTIPPGRTIYLLRQVCSALAEAHDAGLVHRDLKPANLYVSERGGLCDYVKVLDFGLVKLTNDASAPQLTADHIVSGTPHYMAPEQTVGDRDLDRRADVYAIGAIAYHMLTGRPPFEGPTPVAVMIAHASAPVVQPTSLNPEIPKDLEAIVMRCLEKKPADRYADVIELERALNECAAAHDWDIQQAAMWWEGAVLAAAAPAPATSTIARVQPAGL
ncbi:MAG: serine/threonine-protein kinase [Planctomycetaceae bacterium]